jgi:hypothetical protein
MQIELTTQALQDMMELIESAYGEFSRRDGKSDDWQRGTLDHALSLAEFLTNVGAADYSGLLKDATLAMEEEEG